MLSLALAIANALPVEALVHLCLTKPQKPAGIAADRMGGNMFAISYYCKGMLQDLLVLSWDLLKKTRKHPGLFFNHNN